MKSKNQNSKNIFLFWLFIFFIGFAFFQTHALYSQQIKLGWDLNKNPNIFSYNIYRATHLDSAFSLISNVLHPDSTYIDVNMEWFAHYYYAATSVDKSGNESGFSNVIDTTLIFPTSIEQVEFIARLNGSNDVMLEWKIPALSGIYSIELQKRKQNSNDFQTINHIFCNPNAAELSESNFIDKDLFHGNYYYRLKQYKSNNSYEYSEVISISISKLQDIKLFQNTPNPFNSTTRISYILPESGDVKLKIYNINGEEIYKLVDNFQNAGNFSVVWDGVDKSGFGVSSGIYYIHLKTNNQSQFRKMLLIK